MIILETICTWTDRTQYKHVKFVHKAIICTSIFNQFYLVHVKFKVTRSVYFIVSDRKWKIRISCIIFGNNNLDSMAQKQRKEKSWTSAKNCYFLRFNSLYQVYIKIYILEIKLEGWSTSSCQRGQFRRIRRDKEIHA